MYIYEICSYWYNDKEMDNVYSFAHVTNGKQIDYAEYSKMCKEAISKVGNDLIEIKHYLIEKYGFESMAVQERYEYDQDEV